MTTLNVSVETAQALFRQRRDFEVNRLLEYARLGRVEKMLRPYLEALL
jgi:hypothetical protein